MTSHEILKADMLDILFDNRNKQYGAYTLRRYYASRLSTALVVALTIILLLFLIITPGRSIVFQDENKPDVVLHTVDIPNPPLPPIPPVQRMVPPPPSAQSSYSKRIQMVTDPKPETQMKSIEEIVETTISSTNVQGPVTTGILPVGHGTGNTEQKISGDKEETGFVAVERAPEFPGGRQAWANFLNRHLQTPDDLASGEKKVVLISFLVDTDGTVTGFKVVQSGGQAFDNEVIRVLKKMPKWKPAIQNGHPVSVPFTQPVTFVGVEE